MSAYGFPEYVLVAEPIIIEGRTLVKNWWGKVWNRNLGSYADYSTGTDLANQEIKPNDVIIVTVVAEDGKNTVQYKVTVYGRFLFVWQQQEKVTSGEDKGGTILKRGVVCAGKG
jgi:hypothetical protein